MVIYIGGKRGLRVFDRIQSNRGRRRSGLYSGVPPAEFSHLYLMLATCLSYLDIPENPYRSETLITTVYDKTSEDWNRCTSILFSFQTQKVRSPELPRLGNPLSLRLWAVFVLPPHRLFYMITLLILSYLHLNDFLNHSIPFLSSTSI